MHDIMMINYIMPLQVLCNIKESCNKKFKFSATVLKRQMKVLISVNGCL